PQGPVAAPVLHGRSRFEPVNANRLECESNHELSSLLEYSSAPVRGTDGESPLRGAEARLGLANLEDPDRCVRTLERDGKARVAAGRPLPQRPRDEALEAYDGARRR